jgi:hypothetical protein
MIACRIVGALVIPVLVFALVFVSLAIDEDTTHHVQLWSWVRGLTRNNNNTEEEGGSGSGRGEESGGGGGGSVRAAGSDDATGGAGGEHHESKSPKPKPKSTKSKKTNNKEANKKNQNNNNATTKTTTTTTLRVMSYNIQNWDDGQWPSRLPMVVAEIKAADPDIIALQELRRWNDGHAPSQADDLAALLPEYSITWAEGRGGLGCSLHSRGVSDWLHGTYWLS